MDQRPAERDQTATFSLQGDAITPLAVEAATEPTPQPEWVQAAREELPEVGKYLAFDDSGKHIVVPIAQEWTRIGRSLSADIRFDDTTVSRRHALVVSQADGIRILDDRSLNGVHVNGQRVEWSELSDSDEITIGRHRIYFLEAEAVPSGETPEVTTSTE